VDLSLQQLRMLREVARRQTIAAAATSLGYTPSAVSQQLNGLEKATGVAVLERVGRNVRLTCATPTSCWPAWRRRRWRWSG
jgi:DNA-binding transcriptional LysR family regulator